MKNRCLTRYLTSKTFVFSSRFAVHIDIVIKIVEFFNDGASGLAIGRAVLLATARFPLLP